MDLCGPSVSICEHQLGVEGRMGSQHYRFGMRIFGFLANLILRDCSSLFLTLTFQSCCLRPAWPRSMKQSNAALVGK